MTDRFDPLKQAEAAYERVGDASDDFGREVRAALDAARAHPEYGVKALLEERERLRNLLIENWEHSVKCKSRTMSNVDLSCVCGCEEALEPR